MKLYRWQQECLQAWESHQFHGIAHVVTGGGKTFLALNAMERYLSLHPDARIKIVVPTIPLALQWQAALLHCGSPDLNQPGFFGGGTRDRSDRKVMIYIINSARESLSAHVRRSFSLGQHVLLICDECHHDQSPQNRKIFDFLSSSSAFEEQYASLGLSATPFGTGEDEVLLRGLGPVIYRYDFSAASADGIVSPFSVCETAVSFLPEEAELYSELSLQIGILLKRLLEKHPELKELKGNRFLKAVAKIAREESPDASSVAAAYQMKCWKRKEVTVLAQSRLLCGLALIRSLPDTERILIFSERITQAEAMARMIRRSLGNVCGIYHSEMSREARTRNMEAFREGTVRILVSCRCLDEGINVPDASVGIVLSGASVPRQRIQRLGRILRRASGKTSASLYYLYIRESSEDSTFLPGLEAGSSVSLHFNAAEQAFDSGLYEYAARQLLESKKQSGYNDPQLRELRKCLVEGLPRLDYLLDEETLHRLQLDAPSAHLRNYCLAMRQLARFFAA